MTLEAAEAEAQAKIAEITLAQQESDLERALRLFAGGNVPEIEVTNARSAREQAVAELARAQAAVDDVRHVFAANLRPCDHHTSAIRSKPGT